MTIATRLYLGFGILLVLMIGITTFGVFQVNIIDSTLTQVNDVDSHKQRAAINFRGSVHDRAIAIRDYVLVENNTARQKHLRDIAELDDFYQQAAATMSELFSNPSNVNSRERELLQRIQEIEVKTVDLTEQTIEIMAAGNRQQAQDFVLSDVSPAYTAWLAAVNNFIDYQEENISAGVTLVRSESGSFQSVMLGVTLLAVIIGVLVSIRLVTRLTRMIGGEPEEAAIEIQRVADGDLTRMVHTKYPNSIMGAVASMRTHLAAIISDVGSSADTLAAASSQLTQTSSNNEQLVKTQQEQTHRGANAIQQMSETVREVARHTVEASKLAQDTDKEATSGSQEVEKTMASISELADEVEQAAGVIQQLSDSSREIGSVLEVIEGIADQTNLLALNAAIEAARAGEHGRGFAVVADEVRGLANRTQNSTRDIQALIEAMQNNADGAVAVMERGQKKAGESVEQAARAGDSLRRINLAVSDINNMNAQIASAAEEQAAVADDINENFSSITESSEQAAAGSDQVSSASKDLQQLSRKLQESISKFRVNA